MMSIKQNSNKILKYELMLGFAIILMLGIWDIALFYGPITGVDDIGYWCTGYYFAYGSPKDIASGLSYYAYGYGLLLSPLIRLISNEEILYKVIIAVNSILNAGSFLCLVYIAKETFSDISDHFIVLFSFSSVLYVSNFVYSKFIYAESFLTFLVLVICCILVNLMSDYKTWKLLISAILCSGVHFVHQRTLAVTVAYFIFIGLMCLKRRIPLRDVTAAVIVFSLVFCGGLKIKNVVTNSVYNNNTALSLNDYSSNTSKLKLIFEEGNFKYFIMSVAGKVFYFCFGTLLIGPIGFLSYVRQGYRVLTKKKDVIKNESFISLFFACLLPLVVGVASVFMFGPLLDRFELAVYGRYMEYIFGIYIIKGFYEIYKKNKNLIVYCVISLTVCVFGWISVYYQFYLDDAKYSTSWLSPATYSSYYAYGNLQQGMFCILRIILIIGAISLLYCSIKHCYKRRFTIALVLMAIVFWRFNAIDMEKRFVSSQNNLRMECSQVCTAINNNEKEVKYLIDSKNTNRIREMQYFCSSYNFTEYDGDISSINSEDIILTDMYMNDIFSLNDELEVLYRDKNWILWCKKQ